jgi:hypothetical protein
MKPINSPKYATLIAFLLLWLVLGVPSTLAQDPPLSEQGSYQITTPTEGQQLFGLVEIMGSATHPSAFVNYTLEWSNAQNPDIWLPIQQPISQQVSNGILGQWDTVAGAVPDGIYQIRLRVNLSDNSVGEVILRNLVLVNNAPTPLPTLAIPVGNPTSVPDSSGAPLIQQPPSVTPRPTFEQAAPVPLSSDTEDTFINYSAIQSAFCSGVYFTLAFFAFIIGYLLLRSQLSPLTRRIWWQLRSEFDDNRK